MEQCKNEGTAPSIQEEVRRCKHLIPRSQTLSHTQSFNSTYENFMVFIGGREGGMDGVVDESMKNILQLVLAIILLIRFICFVLDLSFGLFYFLTFS